MGEPSDQGERHLKTEVSKGEEHQVTLKIEAGPEDLEGIFEDAYRELGRTINVPGFRKGKVPRKVINSHVGAKNVRLEAIRNGLPTLYLMGVRDSGIHPVSDPEINVLDINDEGSVVFEAKVDVKPEIEVKDYFGIEIERPETEVTEEDVQYALDEARNRFATLEVVEGRPVQENDFVMFDYKVFTDGVPVEGSSGSDRLIEVGAGDFLPGFDEQITGARKGDIIDVTVTFPPDYQVRELAGKPGTFRTIIKEIKRKVFPELDDSLAREISRFETLEEYKEDLRSQIAKIKEATGERIKKDRVVKELVDKTYVDLPESMIEKQVEMEIKELDEDLAQRGITFDDYVKAIKGTRHQIEKAIREKVVESLKAELVLDAVASYEDISIADEEAEQYIKESVEAAGGDFKKVLKEARRQGRIPIVKANLKLSRTVDLMVENAVFKGEGAVSEPEESPGEEDSEGPVQEEAEEAALEEESDETKEDEGASQGRKEDSAGEDAVKEESKET